jgi:hypothetical protein
MPQRVFKINVASEVIAGQEEIGRNKERASLAGRLSARRDGSNFPVDRR